MNEYVELIHDLEQDYYDYEYDINRYLLQDIYNAAEAIKSLIAMNEYLNELNKKLINELTQIMDFIEYPKENKDGA